MDDLGQWIEAEDDGLLPCPDIGSWAETKYRLIRLYCDLFSRSMKGKWRRVYIDLYSGAGLGRVNGTSRILRGSPLLALTVPEPFDRYIFCDEVIDNASVLEQRAKSTSPNADIQIVQGNCDDKIDEICQHINLPGQNKSTLGLCFIDPFNFGFKFETIKKLSQYRVDFVILLAIEMDANRAYDYYVTGKSLKLDEALGGREWHSRWSLEGIRREDFPDFLAREFATSMCTLGYERTELFQMKQVKTYLKHVPLYRLALFSKSKVAFKLWDEVLKYHTEQRSLF